MGAASLTKESYSFSHDTRAMATPAMSSRAPPARASGTVVASASFAGNLATASTKIRASRPPPGGARQPRTSAHSRSSGMYPILARRSLTTALEPPPPGLEPPTFAMDSSDFIVSTSSRLEHAINTGRAASAVASQARAESLESLATCPWVSATLDANAAMLGGVAASRNTPTGTRPLNTVICICRKSIRLRPNS